MKIVSAQRIKIEHGWLQTYYFACIQQNNSLLSVNMQEVRSCWL